MMKKKNHTEQTLQFLPDEERCVDVIPISFLFFAGTFCFLNLLFPVKLYLVPLLLLGLGLIIWQKAWLNRGKTERALILPLIFMLAPVLVPGGLWKNGLALVLNRVLDVWHQNYPHLGMQFEVNAQLSESLSATVFAITLTAAGSLLWVWLVRHFRMWVPVAAAILLLPLQILLGGSLTGAESLVLPVLLLLLTVYGGLRRRAGGDGKARLLVWTGTAAVTLLICGGLVWSGLGAQERRPQAFATAKTAVEKQMQRFRYGGTESRLPEGDFTGLSAREDTEETLLNVTMDTPASMYLKGFAGSVYTGTGFTEPDKETDYEDSDLYYWLHEQGFSGLTELTEASRALHGTADEQTVQVQVENVNASSRYHYIPYEYAGTETDLDRPGDREIRSSGMFGERSYSFTASEPLVPQYRKLAAQLAEQEMSDSAEVLAYLQKEGYYNEKVYAEDLDVPEDLKSLFGMIFDRETVKDGDSHLDYNKAKQLITYYLNDQMTCTDEIVPYDGAEDFVYDFLVRSKKGYDVHYAAAATLMFRYFGIPARYVEGYLVTKDAADGAEPGETIALDGSAAHAWVEYYHDGLGWLPYEVTPDFMSSMEQAEDYQDISDLAAQYRQEQGDGGKESQDTQEDQSEQEDTKEDQSMPSIFEWGKVILLTILLAGLLLLLVFFLWILLERLQTARFKRSFMEADPATAIRNMFTYCAAWLTAYGVPRKVSPYERETYLQKGISPECAEAYREVADIRQEAVYSDHEMTEVQRERVMRFKDRLIKEILSTSSLSERILYRVRYFL